MKHVWTWILFAIDKLGICTIFQTVHHPNWIDYIVYLVYGVFFLSVPFNSLTKLSMLLKINVFDRVSSLFSRPTCRFYKWYNSKISLIFLCLAGFFSRSARFCYSAVITSNHEFQLAWIMLTEKNRHQQHLNVRRACTFGVSVRFFPLAHNFYLFFSL